LGGDFPQAWKTPEVSEPLALLGYNGLIVIYDERFTGSSIAVADQRSGTSLAHNAAYGDAAAHVLPEGFHSFRVVYNNHFSGSQIGLFRRIQQSALTFAGKEVFKRRRPVAKLHSRAGGQAWRVWVGRVSSALTRNVYIVQRGAHNLFTPGFADHLPNEYLVLSCPETLA
jgi:hypothetical protein